MAIIVSDLSGPWHILSQITDRLHSFSSAQIFITVPNVFHLGVEETISVILHNVKNPVNVTIAALEYPGKQRNLATANGIFMSGTFC